MEMITTNLLPIGAMPVCHASQFDKGRVIRFNLVEGEERTPYTLSGTETITAVINKPDGTVVVEDIANTSSNYIDFVTSENTCDVSGFAVCKIVVKKDDKEIGGKQFGMEIEEDAYGGGADIETLTASGPIATFETNMVDNLVDLKAGIEPIQDLHGYDYPWCAGGGKNIACLSEDTVYDLRKITAQYIDNNNVVLSVAGTYSLGIYKIPCTIGKTYTVSFRGICTANYKRVYISKNDNVSGSGNYYGILYLSATEELYKTLTFTAETDNIYIGFYIGTNGEAGTATINDFMIEEGSAATSFAPYSNVCPITGRTETKIVHTGKNWIKNIVAQGQSANHVLLGQSNPNTHETHLKGGTYTISYKTRGSTLPSIYLKKQGVTGNIKLNNLDDKATFTVEDGDYRFWLYKSDGVNYEDIYESQIELGSEVTDYEPYTGTEVTVQFGQTVYKGYLDAKNSKVIATHVLGNFDGSNDETWNDYPAGNGFFISGLSNHIKENYGDGLCNILPTSKSLGKLGVVYGINSYYIFIMQVKTAWNISTVSDLRTFLASNPLQIMYKLAEPIEIPLSAISQFETLLGTNNVYASTGDTELKYLKQM